MIFFSYLMVLIVIQRCLINAHNPIAIGRKKIIPPSQADYLKNVFMCGGSKLPPEITNSGVEALIKLFWPENRTSVWDELRDNVRNLIDHETYCPIHSLLTGRLMSFKRKLEHLAREIKENQSDVSSHYINLAENFVGLEKEAIIRSHNNTDELNVDLLPIYSNIVLMKAAFYSLGIKCHQKVGLTEQNRANLKRNFIDLIRLPINGANDYISQIFRNKSLSGSKYGVEMDIRNMIQEHGYIPIWNNMLDQPGQKLVKDEMIYSNYQGTYLPDTGVSPPPSNYDPLSAAGLSKGKYNEIQKLIIYQDNDGFENDSCQDAIVGMKVILKYNNTFIFGKETVSSRAIQLSGVYHIREIEIANHDLRHGVANIRISLFKLDQNKWKNSSENEYRWGCNLNNSTKKLLLAKKNYYIASIYAFFCDPSLRINYTVYPLLHMGVSYLPLKSHLDDTSSDNDWREWTC